VYCSAACALACALRSSILASPKMMYVSDAGLLNTSGFWMTNRICAAPRAASAAPAAHAVGAAPALPPSPAGAGAHVLALLYRHARHARHGLDAQLGHRLARLLLAAALLAARAGRAVVCAPGARAASGAPAPRHLGTAPHQCRDRLGTAASHGRAAACRSSRQHKYTGGVQSAVAGTPRALPGSARGASRGRAPPSSPSSAASSSSLLRSESSLSMSCRARPGHARRPHGAASEVGLQEAGSAHLHVVGLQLRPRHTGTHALTPPLWRTSEWSSL